MLCYMYICIICEKKRLYNVVSVRRVDDESRVCDSRQRVSQNKKSGECGIGESNERRGAPADFFSRDSIYAAAFSVCVYICIL